MIVLIKKIITILILLLMKSSLAQSNMFQSCISKTFDSIHINWWQMSTYVEKDYIDTFDLVEGKSGDSILTNFNGLVTVMNIGAKSIVIELDQLLAYVIDNQAKGRRKQKVKLPDSTVNLLTSEGWSSNSKIVDDLLVTSFLDNTVRMKLDTINKLIQWIEIETLEPNFSEESETAIIGKYIKRIYRYELMQRITNKDKVREFILYNVYVEFDGKSFRMKTGYENYELNIINNKE